MQFDLQGSGLDLPSARCAISTRIGLLLPTTISVGNPASGVARLAYDTAAALEASSRFDVVRLTPWVHAEHHGLSLIHAFGFQSGFTSLVKNSLRIPVVLTPIHDSQKSPWRYRAAILPGQLHAKILTEAAMKRQLYNKVDRVIALSIEEAERIARACSVPSHRLSVANAAVSSPTTVSESQLRSVKSRYQLPQSFVFALCDYGATRKNIVRLAAACSIARVPLVLAGHPSDTKAWERLRRKAAAGDGLQLLPPVPPKDVPALMQLATVYAQPSLEEGAGLAAMEAATYGCQIVVSRVGGIPEHVGPSAIYVDPKSVHSIAEGILRALTTPFQTQVKDFVLSQRSWLNTVRQLEAIYTSVALSC